jgi:hypothetical protein
MLDSEEIIHDRELSPRSIVLGFIPLPNLLLPLIQSPKLLFTNSTMNTLKLTKLLGIAAATVGAIVTTTPAFGVTLGTLNGTLTDADAIASVTFTAPIATVNFKTTSYGNGNFSPRITLFDASDNYFSEYMLVEI